MRMVEHGRTDQLAWLVRTMVDKIGVWNGPVELRGLFCTRFKPADGIKANCTATMGFTPSDLESRATSLKLPAPEGRNLLAGIVELQDGEDVQAIIDSIAKMPGSGARTGRCVRGRSTEAGTAPTSHLRGT
jgi:hypothetical protein